MKKYNLAIIGLGVGEKVLKSLKNHQRIKKIKIFDFNKNKLKTCKKMERRRTFSNYRI